jgi:hypothetical protein
VFVQPWPAGPSSKRRDQVIYYQFRADRARRTLRGIDEQAAKAAKAVAGLAPVKRNRFIALDGAAKSVNRELEARARDLAGLKGYVTNLAACPDGTPVTPEFVIGSYHELWNIEKSFRMSKHDLRARPIYHRKRDSIEAHLTIVFAALAVTRFIEHRTGWPIKKFVRTARRYRTIQIRAGHHTLTAEDPLPPDLRNALDLIKMLASKATAPSSRSKTPQRLEPVAFLMRAPRRPWQARQETRQLAGRRAYAGSAADVDAVADRRGISERRQDGVGHVGSPGPRAHVPVERRPVGSARPVDEHGRAHDRPRGRARGELVFHALHAGLAIAQEALQQRLDDVTGERRLAGLAEQAAGAHRDDPPGSCLGHRGEYGAHPVGADALRVAAARPERRYRRVRPLERRRDRGRVRHVRHHDSEAVRGRHSEPRRIAPDHGGHPVPCGQGLPDHLRADASGGAENRESH